ERQPRVEYEKTEAHDADAAKDEQDREREQHVSSPRCRMAYRFRQEIQPLGWSCALHAHNSEDRACAPIGGSPQSSSGRPLEASGVWQQRKRRCRTFRENSRDEYTAHKYTAHEYAEDVALSDVVPPLDYSVAGLTPSPRVHVDDVSERCERL